MKNRKTILRGVLLGLKNWLITGFLAPILVETVNAFSHPVSSYQFGGLFSIVPEMILVVVFVYLLLFFLPCILGGILFGRFYRQIAAKPILGSLAIALLVSISGYGIYYFFLLSPSGYYPEKSLWESITIMSIGQAAMWYYAINKFQERFSKSPAP